MYKLIIASLCFLIFVLGAAPASPRDENRPALLTPQEKALVASLPLVRLGLWTNVPPYIMPGPGGSAQGLLPELIDLISQRSGIKFQVKTYASFARAWEGARQGNVDMLGAVTSSQRHQAAFSLTKPYLSIPIALMTRVDHPPVFGFRDLLGKTVIVGKGHVTEQWIKRDYPDIKLIPSEDYSQGLMTVAQGRADAYAGPLGALLHFARKGDLANLKLATATEYEYRLGFAVRKDWPLVPAVLNKAIDTISPKERADIRNRWIVLQTEKTVDWGMVMTISLVIALAAALMIFFINSKNRLLQNEIAERKQVAKELRDAEQRLKDILDLLPDPTWGIDTEGRVILWNRAVENLTGYQAKDMLGKGGYEHALPLYGTRRPCLIDLVLHRDPSWESKYLHLDRSDSVLATAESFHPGLGADGTYLAGSASKLYDSEGNLVGAIETVRDITKGKKTQEERERLISELKTALTNVKTLSGLLPICASCKKIRDDQGYWNEVEVYIRRHSEAGFSHGICPDCAAKLYPELRPSLHEEKTDD